MYVFNGLRFLVWLRITKNDQHVQKTFICPGQMHVFTGLDLFFDFEAQK